MSESQQEKKLLRALVVGDESTNGGEISLPAHCRATNCEAQSASLGKLWQNWGADYSLLIVPQSVWQPGPLHQVLVHIQAEVAVLGLAETAPLPSDFEGLCDAVTEPQESNKLSGPLLDGLARLTKLRRANADLESEAKQLRQRVRVLDQVSEAIIGTDLNGRIKAWNLRAEGMFGYTRLEAMGKPLKFIFEQDRNDGFHLHKVLEPLLIRNHHQLETDIRTRSGSTLPIHASLTLEKNSRGDIVGVICCCRDISLRRRMAREKREAHQRLSFFIERMPLGFIEWGTDGAIRAWNRAAETIFGYTPQEAIGQPYTMMIKEEFIEECQHIFALMAERRGGFRSRNENVTKDGRIIVGDWNNTPLMDENDEIVGFASIVEDITERIRTEKELTRSREAAQSANRSKDEFLAVMSHEVRTPMNSIIGFADLLMDSLDDPELLELVNIIKANAFNLLELISNVLNYSRLEANQVTLEEQDTDLTALLHEIEEVAHAETAEKELSFSTAIAEGTPNHILADHMELRQVLLNLTANAIKFTNAGDVRVRVSGISLSEESPWDWELTFSVSDTGIGISESDQSKLFQSFTQLDSSSTRQFGGTGLGLAICRRIVELWQGRIWAKPNEGGGSIFCFTLPTKAIVPSGNDGPSADSYDNMDDASFIELFPLSIMLISSSEGTRGIVQRIVSNIGYPLRHHSEGVDAVTELQNDAANLILIDQAVSGFSPQELAEFIYSGQAGEGNKRARVCMFVDNTIENKNTSSPVSTPVVEISKPIIGRNLRLAIRKVAVELHASGVI